MCSSTLFDIFFLVRKCLNFLHDYHHTRFRFFLRDKQRQVALKYSFVAKYRDMSQRLVYISSASECEAKMYKYIRKKSINMKTSRKVYNRNNVIIMFKVQEGGKCSSAPTYLESSRRHV